MSIIAKLKWTFGFHKKKSLRTRHPYCASRFRPRLEELEGRIVPADVTFTGIPPVGFTRAAWGVPGNWSSQAIPGEDDTAIIPAGKAVTVNSAVPPVGNLTISSGSLWVENSRSLTVNGNVLMSDVCDASIWGHIVCH